MFPNFVVLSEYIDFMSNNFTQIFVRFYFVIFLSFTDYKILDELIEDQSDGQFSEEETDDLDDIKDLVEDLDGKIKDLVEHLVKDDQDLVKGDQDLIEGDQNVVEGDQDLGEHLVKGDQDIGDEMEESGEVGENNQYYIHNRQFRLHGFSGSANL